MAIFHLSAQIIGRAAGRSATAAAAYRAGVRIEDARTGEVFDYARRTGVRESFILAPIDSPAWVGDRSMLWNRVEQGEKRKDAQVAREVEVSLPHELAHEDRRQLIIEFCREQFVELGMVADVAMHQPGREGDRRNEHAHILLTLRPIEGDGFGQKNRDWNRVELLEQWRARWAEMVNQRLADFGIRAAIDHRSLEAQGLDRTPTVHLGPVVAKLERFGVATERGEIRRLIKERETVVIEIAQAQRQRVEQTELEEMPLETLRRLAKRPPSLDQMIKEDPRLQVQLRRATDARLRVDELKSRMLRARRQQAVAQAEATAWRQQHRLRGWLHDQKVLPAARLVQLQLAQSEAIEAQSRIGQVGLAELKELKQANDEYARIHKRVEQELVQNREQEVHRADVAAAVLARREVEQAPRMEPYGPVPSSRESALRPR